MKSTREREIVALVARMKRELARQDEVLRQAIRCSGATKPELEACLRFAPAERKTAPDWIGARRV